MLVRPQNTPIRLLVRLACALAALEAVAGSRRLLQGPQPAIEPAVAAPNAPVAASPPPGCATLAAPLSAFGAAPPSAVDVDTAACCISLMEGMLLDCAVSLDRVALSGYDRGSELPPSESERALAVDSLVAAGLPVAK